MAKVGTADVALARRAAPLERCVSSSCAGTLPFVRPGPRPVLDRAPASIPSVSFVCLRRLAHRPTARLAEKAQSVPAPPRSCRCCLLGSGTPAKGSRAATRLWFV